MIVIVQVTLEFLRFVSSSESPLFVPSNSSSGVETANLVESTSAWLKKRKISGTGHFKSSWSLPQFITSSTKVTKFEYCKLCYCHFSVSHGGIHVMLIAKSTN